MATKILPTRNEAWGFYGTIAAHADQDRAWALAYVAIGAACDLASPAAVRAFLDSRSGRHFAEDVANNLARRMPLPDAVETATIRWLAWTISKADARRTGIPAGLPYLVGYVLDAGITDEAA